MIGSKPVLGLLIRQAACTEEVHLKEAFRFQRTCDENTQRQPVNDMLDRYDENLILGYIEGDLSENEQAAFEKLLADDDQLRTLVTRLADDRDMLRTVPAVKAPASVLASVNDSLERDMLLGNEGAAGPYRFPVWARWATSMAAMLLLAAGLTWQFDPFNWNDATTTTDPDGDLAINTKDAGTSIERGTGESVADVNAARRAALDGQDDQILSADDQAQQLKQHADMIALAQKRFGSSGGANQSNAGGFSVVLASADVQSTRRVLADWVEANDAVFVSAGEQMAMSETEGPEGDSDDRHHDHIASRPRSDGGRSSTKPSAPLAVRAANPLVPAGVSNAANSTSKGAGNIASNQDGKHGEEKLDHQAAKKLAETLADASTPKSAPSVIAPGSPAKPGAARNIKDDVDQSPVPATSPPETTAPTDDTAKKADRQRNAKAGKKEDLKSLAKRSTELFKQSNSDTADTVEGQFSQGQSLAGRGAGAEDPAQELEAVQELAIAVPADRVDALLAHLNEKFGADQIVIHRRTESEEAPAIVMPELSAQSGNRVPTAPAIVETNPNAFDGKSNENSRDDAAVSPTPSPAPTAKSLAKANAVAKRSSSNAADKSPAETKTAPKDQFAGNQKVASKDTAAGAAAGAAADGAVGGARSKAKSEATTDAVALDNAATQKAGAAPDSLSPKRKADTTTDAKVRSNAKPKGAKRQQRVIISIIVKQSVKSLDKTHSKEVQSTEAEDNSGVKTKPASND